MSDYNNFDVKKEEKKIRKAQKTMKKGIEKRIGKTFSIPAILTIIITTILLLITLHYITTDIVSIVIVYSFLTIIIFFSFTHIIVRYYKERGKTPPKFFRSSKWVLNKIFPVNYDKISPGSALILIYFYLCTVGGVIAIFFYGFSDALSLSFSLPVTPSNYGFFSFIFESMSYSMMPLILFLIFIIAPIFFCLFLLISALIYKNNDKSRLTSIICFLPIFIFLPFFFNLNLSTIYFLIPFFIFIGAWGSTLGLFFRFTKRSAFVCLAIGFLQLLSIFYINYMFLLFPAYEILYLFKPPFILFWISILFGIPIIVKFFDFSRKGGVKLIGVIISVIMAFLLQVLAILKIVELFTIEGMVNIMDIQLFGGFGFFYFYLYLILLPLFFIFGYFQIGLARMIYRNIVKFGKRVNMVRFFSVIAAILSIILLGVLVWYNYFFSHTSDDYLISLYYISTLYNGSIINILRSGSILWAMGSDYSLITNLIITEGLLAYSSYRSSYNLAKFGDQLKENTKEFTMVKVFREPAAYKSRILLGLAIISIFLGTISMYGFLRIHTVIFGTVVSDFSSIIFQMVDSLKLIFQIFGIVIAGLLFFYYLFRK